MVNRQTVGIVGVVLLALLAAFAIPVMNDAATQPQTDTYELDEGGTVTVTDGLTATLSNSTQSESDVTFRDNETRENTTVTVQEDSTEPWTLAGESGNVTVTDSAPNSATVEIEYPPTYGWSGPAKTIASELGFILMIMVFVIVVGGMKAVIPE